MADVDTQVAVIGAGPGGYAAAFLAADLGLQVAFADMGGWDTHVNQGAAEGQLAQRLREVGGTLAAFARDLGDRMADVVVLTMSEFGRTVRENGSGGTDHGRATAMLLLGGGVAGGRVYGRWPGLAPGQLFEGRDLRPTLDTRAVLKAVIEGTFDLTAAQAGRVFPGSADVAGLGNLMV